MLIPQLSSQIIKKLNGLKRNIRKKAKVNTSICPNKTPNIKQKMRDPIKKVTKNLQYVK